LDNVSIDQNLTRITIQVTTNLYLVDSVNSGPTKFHYKKVLLFLYICSNNPTARYNFYSDRKRFYLQLIKDYKFAKALTHQLRMQDRPRSYHCSPPRHPGHIRRYGEPGGKVNIVSGLCKCRLWAKLWCRFLI